MKQDKKSATPSRQDPERGNKTDPRLKEPVSPGQYRSGIDEPGSPTKKNPGHTNPTHSPPDDVPQDQPGQQDPGKPGQEQTQSYPGIKGLKARELWEDEAKGKKHAKSDVIDKPKNRQEIAMTPRKLEKGSPSLTPHGDVLRVPGHSQPTPPEMDESEKQSELSPQTESGLKAPAGRKPLGHAKESRNDQ